jgi:hypothetical protein
VPRTGVFIHPEEERARKRAVGTEEQDGLAGKGKEAGNDEAHRARVGGGGGPAQPEAGPPSAVEIGSPVSGIAVRRAAPNPRCPRVGMKSRRRPGPPLITFHC